MTEETKSVGFYPGCSLNGSAGEYKTSVQSLAEAFGIRLAEIPDWNCCGATAAHNLNRKLSVALPARILANAAEAGMHAILAPCAACYSRLALALHELRDAALKKETENLIEKPIDTTVQVINIVQFIEQYIQPELPAKLAHPFTARTACYYGCLLVRPHGVLKFDRTEDPLSIDRIMQSIGAETVDWPFKTECCGAGLSVSRTDLAARLSGKIISEASERGAEVVVVACPMCHANLDMRRGDIRRFTGLKSDIPVLYLSQAIGMAIGLDPEQTGIRRHMVPIEEKKLCAGRPAQFMEE